ncbi:NADP-dependent oxidoreductase [Georgenia sp. MJ170]|uniref:NADP-dependent oxidoreductase n=1 Tax=Georgenia sunbinii TaxID=3117728 RepID=UPI002F26189D
MPKVYVFTAPGGPENQQLVERPALVPGAGELAVAVRAAGVNPADWKIRAGLFGATKVLPAPLGLELAGVVTAVGPGVTGVRIGDAVLGPPAPGAGAFAEQTLVRAAAVVAKPASIGFEPAATLPIAGTTAYDLVHQVPLGPGQSVVVLGAGGGVGRLAVQLARARGARVLGVASEAKRQVVESAGAVHVPSGPHAPQAVRTLLPDGADLIVDLVGGEVLRSLGAALAATGTVVTAADPGVAAELGGSGRQHLDGTLAAVAAAAAAGVVDPLVTAAFPLDQAGAALAAVEAGHTAGKIVIVP